MLCLSFIIWGYLADGSYFFRKITEFWLFSRLCLTKKKSSPWVGNVYWPAYFAFKNYFLPIFWYFFAISPRYQIFDFFRKKKKKLKRPIFFWNISNIKAYRRKCTRRGTRNSGLLISTFSKRMSLEEFLNLGWFESQNYASSIEKTITTSLCINRKNKKIITLDFFWERFKHCSIRT